MIRLNKFLASTGKFSRRLADELIAAGKIKVNDQVVAKLGTMIDPETDQVFYLGARVLPQPKKVYLVLHKPKGFVTTKKDPEGRPTVMNLVPRDLGLFPVGRLYQYSEGLLLLTNDGDWAEKLLHPRYEKTKEYSVNVTQKITPEQLARLRQGVFLSEGLAKPDLLRLVADRQLIIVIHQGWKRQIRRMCEEVGLTVTRLVRVKLGKLDLGTLPAGKWQFIKEEDV
ncbi:MAG: pseudouridine synthase [Candidatus Komeilibacteria bacterium]|nr:pseudouridine synthase [Candidatus Komeilibacteria bacterium]